MLGLPGVATAVNNDRVEVFFDAPLVQGSYLTGSAPEVKREDFNSYAAAACPSEIAVGSVSGSCLVRSVADYGGATAAADDTTATVGGAGSMFATTAPNTSGMEFTLTDASKYVGVWWSAGSPTNYITFYMDDVELISLTTADLMGALGTQPTFATWASLDAAGDSLTALNGNQYKKVWYYGNPRGYSSNPPTAYSGLGGNEPFVYLHLFAQGNLAFNKIKFSGNGFEFDNLVVSTLELTPPENLVPITTIYGNHSVTFDANGGSGEMAASVDNAPANLPGNAFTRDGYNFAGWNTAADGSGTAYADGAEYAYQSALTLYAQWTAIAPPEPVKRSITTTVYFKSASNSLIDNTKRRLDSLLAQIPAGATNIRATARGFVQPVGVKFNDFRLSDSRARNVLRYLRNHGVSGKLTRIAAGRESDPTWKARKVVVTVTFEVRPS